jgi:hypothetical protein
MASAIQSLVPDRNPKQEAYRKFLDLALTGIIAKGGGTYCNVMPQIVPQVPAQVLFHTPRGASLRLPLLGISSLGVAARIAENELSWAAAIEVVPVVLPLQEPSRHERVHGLFCQLYQSLVETAGDNWHDIQENFRRMHPRADREAL